MLAWNENQSHWLPGSDGRNSQEPNPENLPYSICTLGATLTGALTMRGSHCHSAPHADEQFAAILEDADSQVLCLVSSTDLPSAPWRSVFWVCTFSLFSSLCLSLPLPILPPHGPGCTGQNGQSVAHNLVIPIGFLVQISARRRSDNGMFASSCPGERNCLAFSSGWNGDAESPVLGTRVGHRLKN